MWKRLLLSGLSILIAWMFVDLVMHRFVLASLYEQTPALWRPFDQMSVPLIYVLSVCLIAIEIGIYLLHVRPKSVSAGLRFGALIGLVFGLSSGFGTYVHSPIPLALAWGWLATGLAKGLSAGAIAGALVPELRGNATQAP